MRFKILKIRFVITYCFGESMTLGIFQQVLFFLEAFYPNSELYQYLQYVLTILGKKVLHSHEIDEAFDGLKQSIIMARKMQFENPIPKDDFGELLKGIIVILLHVREQFKIPAHRMSQNDENDKWTSLVSSFSGIDFAIIFEDDVDHIKNSRKSNAELAILFPWYGKTFLQMINYIYA